MTFKFPGEGVRSSCLDHPVSVLLSQFFRDCEPATGTDWASQCAKWLVTSFMNERASRFAMGCVDFHQDKLRSTCSRYLPGLAVVRITTVFRQRDEKRQVGQDCQGFRKKRKLGD